MSDAYPEYLGPGNTIARKGIIRWLRSLFGMPLEYPLRDKEENDGPKAA